MNNKVRDCILSIKSTVTDGREKETSEYTYEGRMMVDEQSGLIKVSYKEETEDGTLKNLMSIESSEIRITKVGKMKAELEFKQGQKSHLSYSTPYGNMLIPVITNVLKVDEKTVHLMYEMPDAGTTTDMLIALALR